MSVNPPSRAAAAEPAPLSEGRVYLRDHDGGMRRVTLALADSLVANGLGERTSKAGHVKLAAGLRIDKIKDYFGARASTTTIGRQDVKRPHRRCNDWRARA